LGRTATVLENLRVRKMTPAPFRVGARTVLIFLALVLSLAVPAITQIGVSRMHPALVSFMMLALWAGLIVDVIAQSFWIGKRRIQVRAGWIMTAILVTGLTLPTFLLFKQIVLPSRGFPLDPVLAQIDHFLFFGHDAWEVTHFFFGSLTATLVFDKLYAIWMPLMFLFPAVAVMAVSGVQLRTRMLASWLASWVFIACIAAWVFASAGPCYYTDLVGPHAGFAALHDRLATLAQLARAEGKTLAVIDFQQMLLREMRGGALQAVGGISAMPSMHVAMASLFAMAGHARSRSLGWIMTFYAMGVWIGSIHLGWHYAIDGIVGAGMMAGLWIAIGRIVKRLSRGNLPLPQAPFAA
jgi:PAP2 superfamily